MYRLSSRQRPAGGALVITGITPKPGNAAITLAERSASLASVGGLVLDGKTLLPGGAGVTVKGTSAYRASSLSLMADSRPGCAGAIIHRRLISFAPDGCLVIGDATLRADDAGSIKVLVGFRRPWHPMVNGVLNLQRAELGSWTLDPQ